MKILKILLSTLFVFSFSGSVYAIDKNLGDGWCSDVRIHFFAGGAEGDGFAGIVQTGAENAIRDTGADAEILYSEWQSDRMIQQLREAIGAGVDGIGMMGHPGDDAIMPLAKMASEAGILMMYQNVDVPAVRAAFGGGYVGANLATQGKELAREAIGAGVDGIGMMGHPGDDAIMPLAKMASEAGILMMYQNVDVPAVRAAYGGGYVGANLATQGKELAREAIRRFDLKAGDTAIVMVPIGDYSRAQREDGARIIFEEHGMNVVVLDGTPEQATDPNLAIPVFSAALAANPDTKIIVHDGGQKLGNAEAYAKAAGYGPGELLQIGFDTSPQIMTAFENGYVHLTSDQQPFLQGYLPVLALCQMKVLGTGALNQDTGAGFVHTENYKSVMELANAGLR